MRTYCEGTLSGLVRVEEVFWIVRDDLGVWFANFFHTFVVVVDICQDVAHGFKAGTALVVRPYNGPRTCCRVRKMEHLVARPRVSFPLRNRGEVIGR